MRAFTLTPSKPKSNSAACAGEAGEEQLVTDAKMVAERKSKKSEGNPEKHAE